MAKNVEASLRILIEVLDEGVIEKLQRIKKALEEFQDESRKVSSKVKEETDKVTKTVTTGAEETEEGKVRERIAWGKLQRGIMSFRDFLYKFQRAFLYLTLSLVGLLFSLTPILRSIERGIKSIISPFTDWEKTIEKTAISLGYLEMQGIDSKKVMKDLGLDFKRMVEIGGLTNATFGLIQLSFLKVAEVVWVNLLPAFIRLAEFLYRLITETPFLIWIESFARGLSIGFGDIINKLEKKFLPALKERVSAYSDEIFSTLNTKARVFIDTVLATIEEKINPVIDKTSTNVKDKVITTFQDIKNYISKEVDEIVSNLLNKFGSWLTVFDSVKDMIISMLPLPKELRNKLLEVTEIDFSKIKAEFGGTASSLELAGIVAARFVSSMLLLQAVLPLIGVGLSGLQAILSILQVTFLGLNVVFGLLKLSSLGLTGAIGSLGISISSLLPILAALGLVALALYGYFKQHPEVLERVMECLGKLGEVVGWVCGRIWESINILADVLGRALERIIWVFQRIIDGLMWLASAFSFFFGNISRSAEENLNRVEKSAKELYDNLVAHSVFPDLVRGIGMSMNKIRDELNISEEVKDNFKNIKSYAEDLYYDLVGHSIFPDLVRGIRESIGEIDEVLGFRGMSYSPPSISQVNINISIPNAYITGMSSIEEIADKLSDEIKFNMLRKGILR